MDEENNKIILYKTEDGETKIEVQMQDETVWLSQDQMAELFNKAKSTINEHIKNIYNGGELVLDKTMRKFGNSEFSTKPTNLYNLDVIISVGYRVNSLRGTQFRIWATEKLRDYIVEAFTGMQDGLNKEKRVYEKIWAEREKQIQRVVKGTVGMYGDLSGLVALPQIKMLELEEEEEEKKQDDLFSENGKSEIAGL